MNSNVKKLSKLLIFVPIIGFAEIISGIDSRFKLKKLEQIKNRSKSPGISFYQGVLSRSLGSHCSMYPNDSRYSQILFKRCTLSTTILRSMSRFYQEPDASTNKLKMILKDKIYYEDLPSNCDTF